MQGLYFRVNLQVHREPKKNSSPNISNARIIEKRTRNCETKVSSIYSLWWPCKNMVELKINMCFKVCPIVESFWLGNFIHLRKYKLYVLLRCQQSQASHRDHFVVCSPHIFFEYLSIGNVIKKWKHPTLSTVIIPWKLWSACSSVEKCWRSVRKPFFR